METEIDGSNLLSPTTHTIIAFIYLIIALVSFVLNSIVLLTFIMDRSLLFPGNLFIISIATSDWLMGVLANPMGFASNLSGAWTSGKSTCVFYAFMTTFLGLGTMLNHTAFAVDRYVSVSWPMKTNLTVERMSVIIASLWVFSLIWSLCPLLGWSAYVPEGGNVACSIRWQSSRPTDTSYIICLFFFFYFGPIAIIVICNSLMVRNVKFMSKNAARIWGTNAAATLETVLASWKMSRIAMLMMTGYLSAWTPYAIVSLWAAFGSPGSVPTLGSALPALFAKTSTMYNPVIYFFTYRIFRERLINIWRQYRNRNVVQPLNTASRAGFVVFSRECMLVSEISTSVEEIPFPSSSRGLPSRANRRKAVIV